MYGAKFSPKATRFFRKLPENIQVRIKEKFREVQKEPFCYLEHFEGKNYYKLRIGN
jgi:mRNA-degrading endonuclease RelE of RelBE toxin-antitoxin system